MRALIVEDEPRMASLIRRGIARDGVDGDVVGSGEEALVRLAATAYDAIILDLGLPGIDGIETCRRLRERGDWTPTLVLTARPDLEARVDALDGGADDYVLKPFALAELLARLRAITRRGAQPAGDRVAFGDLQLDARERRVWRGDTEVALSPQEFALLETFMRHPNQLLSRHQLLEHAWPYSYSGTSNVVDVYVRYLRAKIDLPFGRSSIETVRGVGYRLAEAGAE